MNKRLFTLDTPNPKTITVEQKQHALSALENEQALFFPNLPFNSPQLSDNRLWSDALLDRRHKNISYNHATQQIGKLSNAAKAQGLVPVLHTVMQSYAEFAKKLIDTLLPSYQDALIFGRTSYRPGKITQNTKSKRKDDTRLHIDSFSATPVYGRRILRVFTNINPYNEPRIWHLGDSFDNVLQRFAKDIPQYNYLTALFLLGTKTTKTLRSPYDHYQIHLHDSMKRDDAYQRTVTKEKIDFPTHSTWIVFTDQTSHAALGGQFLLEQTFYLPIAAMNTPELSPFKRWEKALNRVLD